MTSRLVVLAALLSCSPLKETSHVIAVAAVDCTRAESARAIAELGPVIDVVLSQAVDAEAKVDWAPLKSLTRKFSAEVGGCVLADVVSRALAPPVEDGAPRASSLVIDHLSLLTGFRAVAEERWGGVTFHTARGDI